MVERLTVFWFLLSVRVIDMVEEAKKQKYGDEEKQCSVRQESCGRWPFSTPFSRVPKHDA